ncbi:PREDICTED: putative glucose-6-phosphate 1-epimerase, partial [Erythranthe guttata]|uniref:putative glucose-6-phosphate 1-epimerase n=1 Tax=Erythranthe guttata TaxID=4155 RepID=UPI00064DF45C
NFFLYILVVGQILERGRLQTSSPDSWRHPNLLPKFFDEKFLEKHGFARTEVWILTRDTAFPPPTPDHAYVDFLLDHKPDDFQDWPNHKFELRLRVILGPTGDLTMTTRVKNVNTNGEPFAFKFAYHSYFSVSNILATRIEGLQGLDYRDYLDHDQFTEEAGVLTFEEELDRAYLNTPDEIRIRDLELRRVITIYKDDSLPEIVVWNPWEDDAGLIPDF